MPPRGLHGGVKHFFHPIHPMCAIFSLPGREEPFDFFPRSPDLPVKGFVYFAVHAVPQPRKGRYRSFAEGFGGVIVAGNKAMPTVGKKGLPDPIGRVSGRL